MFLESRKLFQSIALCSVDNVMSDFSWNIAENFSGKYIDNIKADFKVGT